MKTVALSLILICASACSVSAQRRTLTFENPAEMFRLLNGEWSYDTQDCQQPFVFTVASDRKSIKGTYRSFDAQTKQELKEEFTYRVIDANKLRIRAQIEGEKRLTADGKPVVWDFYFFSRDEFRWHRTDWGKDAFTPPVTRCKEERQ